MRRFLVVLAVMIAPGAASAEPACRVLDPELVVAYQGGCKDGLADGHGAARGIAEYQGGFRAGRKHGKGVKTWPWGDRYEGEFADDRKQGAGIYTWGPHGPSAGERYAGEYFADRRHGFGTYSWPDGEAYAGQWKMDQIVGTPTGRMFERARVRTRTEMAARAAVAKPGARVCRQIVVGISERDWVRGVVAEVRDGDVGVKIDDPGRFPHTLNGAGIVPGAVVWDAAAAWLPCLDEK